MKSKTAILGLISIPEDGSTRSMVPLKDGASRRTRSGGANAGQARALPLCEPTAKSGTMGTVAPGEMR
jgi:hypothetical protein